MGLFKKGGILKGVFLKIVFQTEEGKTDAWQGAF